MKKFANTFFLFIILFSYLLVVSSCNKSRAKDIKIEKTVKKTVIAASKTGIKRHDIDTVEYNKRMLALSNNDTSGKWPVKTPYPLPGAILPYNRIIAFYGNLYSKRMGVLGELPKNEMLKKLQSEVTKWQKADSSTKAIPALHYIAITAQGSPGNANLHRMRMPFKQIDTIMNWAKSINALVFLDVQVGHSNVKDEVATLEPYLKLSNVHLGIDPEFSLKNGEIPGTKIGTFTADDINDAIDILVKIVRENNLPPKVLIVHRFTQGMVTNYKKIKTVPEVQIVMNMDGFGSKILKKSTYLRYIYREPVQFTGLYYFIKTTIKTDGKCIPLRNC